MVKTAVVRYTVSSSSQNGLRATQPTSAVGNSMALPCRRIPDVGSSLPSTSGIKGRSVTGAALGVWKTRGSRLLRSPGIKSPGRFYQPNPTSPLCEKLRKSNTCRSVLKQHHVSPNIVASSGDFAVLCFAGLSIRARAPAVNARGVRRWWNPSLSSDCHPARAARPHWRTMQASSLGTTNGRHTLSRE